MTKAELEQIQTVCREWLRQPERSESRLTIPAGSGLSRAIQIERKAILTFDNLLITTAVDAETGAKYAGLIQRPDEPDEFLDIPYAMVAEVTPLPASEAPAPPPLRATQRRYQEAMDLLAQHQRESSNDFDAPADYSQWLDNAPSAARDLLPSYLVYSGSELLGYTMLERIRSARERDGRFYPSEDYFAYADIFTALPDAEEEYLEAAVRTAYGLIDHGSDESWKRFNDLSAQVEALALYLQTEDGKRMEVMEVRLVDLSHKYDDQTERWLYITVDE